MVALKRGSGKIRYALLATVLIVTACGDDDPTGPGNQDIVGEWSYVITDLVGSGATCNLTGITLTFTRSGGTVEGTFLAIGTDNWTCVAPEFTASSDFNPGEGELEGVTVNGSNVAFKIPSFNGDFDSTGTVNGNSMGGNVTYLNETAPDPVLQNGTWAATRN